jgi:hypothetical protein
MGMGGIYYTYGEESRHGAGSKESPVETMRFGTSIAASPYF